MKTLKQFGALLLSLAMFAGCGKYDDSELNGRVDDLENRVKTIEQIVSNLNTNINALVTTVDALKNQDYITSVSELSDKSGYEIVFAKSGKIIVYHGKNGVDGNNGKDGADGKDGSSPEISVKLDADGNYYWWVNGGWLLDNGNKIPATAKTQVPQIRINEGNFELSFDGENWLIIGTAGNAGIFKEVVPEEDKVTFYLYDGEPIVIPMTRPFVINVESTDVRIAAGETAVIQYTITAADEATVVDAFGTKGFEAEVFASDFSSGSVNITAPNPLGNGKVYLFAMNSNGATAARILSFEEGTLIVDDSVLAEKIPAKGGEVKVPVSTNCEYMAMVDPAYSWITLLETRSLRSETLTFVVSENVSSEPREGTFMIINLTEPGEPQMYTIYQDGASDEPQPAGGGTADFETFNGGVPSASISTYNTVNGWTLVKGSLDEGANDIYSYGRVLVPRLAGKPAQKGILSSPVLSGGCGRLYFQYAKASTFSGLRFVIEIKDSEGNVLRTETMVNDDTPQYTVFDASYDVNIAGDFQVVITNDAYHNSALKPDQAHIISLSWTGYSE